MSTVTDGALHRGILAITLDVSGLTLIVDSHTFKPAHTHLMRTDENDAPAAQTVYPGWKTGSLNYQINAAAAGQDLVGDTFTTDGLSGASQKWLVVDQDVSKSKSALSTGTLQVSEYVS